MKTKPKSYGVEYTPTHMRFPCDHCNKQIGVTWEAVSNESIKEAEKQAELRLIKSIKRNLSRMIKEAYRKELEHESFQEMRDRLAWNCALDEALINVEVLLEEKKASILKEG